jgi:protein MpaA
MNTALLPTLARSTAFRSTRNAPSPTRRSLDRILAPLDELACTSDHFLRKPLGRHADGSMVLPRYLHLGPRGGGDYVRLGIFASIHGDEPEGALALTRFVSELERQPELAKGYAIFIYPVCNPTGFEDNTRHSRSGKDLNREFWRDSTEPEIRWLETEIWTHAFHGIINLHSDDTSQGLYGFVNGEVLSEYLLEPALQSAEAHLPRDRRRRIDGFQAKRGMIYECYEGVLRSVPGLSPAPFELTLETPHKAPLHRQVEAFNAALQTILVEYRYLTAVAQGI